jgi:hypothetical protein
MRARLGTGRDAEDAHEEVVRACGLVGDLGAGDDPARHLVIGG